MARPRVPEASAEFSDAEFGDERLTRRLARIADVAARAPGAGFPAMVRSDSELEGVYRFLRNERVTPARILAPHVAETLKRAQESPVVIAHDTTQFAFTGKASRLGLGRVGTSYTQQGFFGHFALAISGDESRTPLGVAGIKTFVRSWEKRSTISAQERDLNPDLSESRKWIDLVRVTTVVFPRAIHVMDREADSFTLFARLIAENTRFVVRLGRDKNLADPPEKLFAAAERAPVHAVRSVPISRRPRHKSGAARMEFPPRHERTARLELRAATFTLPRPNRPRFKTGHPESLSVNVVTVVEPDPPTGQEPVCWRLLTTEPIDKPEQVEAVVDAYRARWRIEEFFKALKTGCSLEKRQLESLQTLVNALAMFSVIAWRLLVLRTVANLAPDAPATHAVSPQQVRLLQALSKAHPDGLPRLKVPREATAKDVLLAVAALGGHIKNNGPPGWQVLGRGYDALLLIQLGWQARERCDR